MRRRALVPAALLALAGALAGCSADGPAPLSVTTPPPSATAGPGSVAPRTPPAAPTGSPATVPGSPLASFQSQVAEWQRARSAFFAEVSSGKPLTVAQQRALATTLLAAEKRFAAKLQAADWPGVAQIPVSVLLGRIRGQQASITAMTEANSKSEFAARLAEYGVNAGPENQAVATMATSLQ